MKSLLLEFETQSDFLNLNSNQIIIDSPIMGTKDYTYKIAPSSLEGTINVQVNQDVAVIQAIFPIEPALWEDFNTALEHQEETNVILAGIEIITPDIGNNNSLEVTKMELSDKNGQFTNEPMHCFNTDCALVIQQMDELEPEI